MGMIDKLYQLAPKTTNQFMNHMMSLYGVDREFIEKAPLVDRYFEVLKFFGYPALLNEGGMTNLEIIDKIKHLFVDQERLFKKQHEKDIINDIKNFTEEERKQEFPEIYQQPKFNRAFVNCLTRIRKNNWAFINCLVKIPVTQKKSDEIFWNKQIFSEIVRAEEIPF